MASVEGNAYGAVAADGVATGGDGRCAIEFPVALAAARTGAPWGVEALFRRYNPMLTRYLRSRESDEADDLVGEVWLTVAGHLADFDGGEAGFRAWLFTIARRRVIDHRRRRGRRRTDPVPGEQLVDHWVVGDPADPVVDALSTQAVLDGLVGALPPDQADVVLLRVLAGLNATEVGMIMGHTAGWVRVVQHRALRRLAAQSALVPKPEELEVRVQPLMVEPRGPV